MTAFSSALRGLCVAALVAAAFGAVSPAAAQQRLSLAERVERLEQQAGNQGSAQSGVELVNQIQALQSQVQNLQGQVEELKHQLDSASQRNTAQYVDLDSRIGRLEGRAPGASAPAGAAGGDSGQLGDVELGGASAPASAPPAAAANSPQPPVDSASNMPAPASNIAPPVAADPAAEKAVYDAAFSALKDGRYAESARRFQGFIDQYPNSDLSGNAYYWLGESYYVTQNYRIAQQTFQTLLQRYPTNQKSGDALLKIGYCQYETKQWDQAESTLTDVVQQYPDTTVARLAQARLRALKLEGRR